MFRVKSSIASIFLALLLGPWFVIPALLILVIFTDVTGMNDLALDHRSFLAFSGIAFIGLMYAYPITVLFGLPVFLILRKFKLDKLPILLSVSLLPALLAYLAGESSLSGALSVALFSVFTAFGCWLIYYYTHPLSTEARSEP